MKTFKNLKLNDVAWILDESFNVYEVKLINKDICEGFTDNIIVYQFCDIFDNETIVSLPESSNEQDENWAFCADGKIYLDKEPILKKLEIKSKDINNTINYFRNVKSEMVNKSEFIAKVKKWLELETNWDQKFDENGRNENYGKIDELIKYLEE